MSGLKKKWTCHVIEVPITVTLDPYVAGDAVGGRLTLTPPDSFGSCYIAWARLIDDADQAEPFALWAFYAAPTSIDDADPFTMTEADWQKWFTTLDIAEGDYDQTGSEACAIASGKDKTSGEYHMAPMPVDGNLYLYLVPSATPDYADADDLTLHVALMVQ